MRKDTELFELEDEAMEGVRKTILSGVELSEEIPPNTCWLTCRWDFYLPNRESKEEASLYLWMDAASGYLVGGYLKADRGYWESAGWLESFRRIAERYGIPKKIITDEDEIPENKAGKFLGKRANKLTDAAADFPLWMAWKETVRVEAGKAGYMELNGYVEEYLKEINRKWIESGLAVPLEEEQDGN